MLISAFTILRNAVTYGYPFKESIFSILPIVDEFIINVGKSDDNTLREVQSIRSDKIRIIETQWDFSMREKVLSFQTNVALKECKGQWAFYLQSDEVIHENDMFALKELMQKNSKADVDAIRFRWLHFYGSYYRYRIDAGWYQKQDRIIRNNGAIVSDGDAYGFKRVDDKPIRRINSNCLLYHYGWVHAPGIMTKRRENARNIGFGEAADSPLNDYGDLNQFPVYFGSHPLIMQRIIENHSLSQDDKEQINRRFWWYPPKILKLRYKTFLREKKKLAK